MEIPLQVTFRGFDGSAAIEAKVRERANKLERFYDRIISCRVLIEDPHRHQHKGKLYHVRIDLTVPQQELVVSHDPGNDHGHEDVYVAIRDAFEAAERQLDEFARRRRDHKGGEPQ